MVALHLFPPISHSLPFQSSGSVQWWTLWYSFHRFQIVPHVELLNRSILLWVNQNWLIHRHPSMRRVMFFVCVPAFEPVLFVVLCHDHSSPNDIVNRKWIYTICCTFPRDTCMVMELVLMFDNSRLDRSPNPCLSRFFTTLLRTNSRTITKC